MPRVHEDERQDRKDRSAIVFQRFRHVLWRVAIQTRILDASDTRVEYLMRAPTNAEHQRAVRAARKASGLKRVEVWAHPGDEDAIKDHARKLAVARKTKEAQP